jgi:hypothetical protein
LPTGDRLKDRSVLGVESNRQRLRHDTAV